MMRAISFLVLPALLFAQGDALVNGLTAFHNGDYVKAEREFRVALDRKDDPRARAFLALTLAATNRCEAATPGLTQSLESPDADLRKLGGLALVQCDLARNRFDEAA